MKKYDFSVVVPVYNSEKTLLELNSRLFKTMEKMERSFEIIYVNDASRDGSWLVLKKIKPEFDNVIIVNLYKNYGQHNALMCGFNKCSGEYIITIDDDLQNPPEEIPVLYDKIEEGYDVVFGAYKHKKDVFYKNLGSYAVRKINHTIFHISKEIKISSFRMIRREVIAQIKRIKTPFPYVSGMILTVSNNVGNAVVNHEKRVYGSSNYNLKKLIHLSFNLFINYSSIPLKIIGYLGLIVSFLSFFTGAFFMGRQLWQGRAPEGWTSLIVLLSFYNTIILVIFFILGEYISRILREISHEKQYYVKEVER